MVIHELWLAADAARELGITPAGVHSLVLAGRLSPMVRTPGGVRLFNPDEVRALKEQRAAARALQTS